MQGGGSATMALAAMAIALASCGGGRDEPAAAIDVHGRQTANVLLLVDSSESMGDGDLADGARRGIERLADALPADDSVGLATFSDAVRFVVPVFPVSRNRAQLRKAAAALKPGGGSSLFDSTLQGYGILRELADSKRLNAVVVLAHARDSASANGLAKVRRLLGAQGSSGPRVRVFTVAYDAEDDVRTALGAMARASKGRAVGAGEPDDLEPALRKVWAAL